MLDPGVGVYSDPFVQYLLVFRGSLLASHAALISVLKVYRAKACRSG